MSGYYNQSDSYEDDNLGDNSGGGLRRQLEDALAELKALRQEVSGSKREETVASLLKDKGLDPAVAELIPSDADPKAWLEQKGHLFVAPAPVVDETKPDAEAQARAAQQTEEANALEAAAREQMANAEAAGYTAVSQSDIDRIAGLSDDDFLAELAKARADGAGS